MDVKDGGILTHSEEGNNCLTYLLEGTEERKGERKKKEDGRIVSS